MRTYTGKVCLLAAGLWLACSASAQLNTPSAITPAGSPDSPVSGSGIEQYNGFNGYLNLSVPLHHIGGRGEAGFDLVWNLQPGWQAAYNGTPANAFIFAEPYPSSNTAGATSNAYALGGPGAVYIRTGYIWQNCTAGGDAPSYSVTSITLVTPNGGQVSLLDTATNGAPVAAPANLCTALPTPATWDGNRGTSFRSTDGSQIQFNATSKVLEQNANVHGYGLATVSGTLVFPSGATYTVVNSQITVIEDRNGNKISLTYGGPAVNIDWYLSLTALTQVTDSLNRITKINYNDTTSCNGCLTINYPGAAAAGSTHTIKVTTDLLNNKHLRSDYSSTTTIGALFGTAVFGAANPYNPTVATSVILPDSSQYGFQYNTYGEVARITLPTGGAIEYDYAPGSGSSGGYVSSTGGASGGIMIYRRLAVRREYAQLVSGSLPGYTSETTHTITYPSGETVDTVQVTDPTNKNTLLGQTIHTFSGSPLDTLTMTATSCNPVNEGLETETDTGYSSAVVSVVNTYTNSYFNGKPVSCINNPQLTTRTTTSKDIGQQTQTVYGYDIYNNPNDEQDYDWGAGKPGALLRETKTTYKYQNDARYANASVNLIRLPYSQFVYSGSTVVADTEWRYDELAVASASGMANNDATGYGPANNLRGNLTDSYKGYGSGEIQTSGSQYDVGGNLLYRGDADGNSMYYSYNDDSSNLYAFPTHIKDGVQSSKGVYSNLTYDYNAGKPLTITDPVSNLTSFIYNDPFDRVTQITEPTGALSKIMYMNPAWTVATHSLTSSTTTQTQVVTDGFGRDIEDRQVIDGSHLIAVDRSFDAVGRMSSQTNPSLVTYSATSWSPDGLGYPTRYTFDYLNRVVNLQLADGNSIATSYSGNATTVTDALSKATKTVTDGLGRVSKVFEDPAKTNLETDYTYDVLGDLTKVTKCAASGCASGGQTRTYAYDSLARLTSANNPESGTYSYSYSNGSANLLALQSRTDPRTYKTTYMHDVMDRVTGITYTDGTPNAGFTFDVLGRLTQSTNGTVVNNYLTFDGDSRVKTSNVVVQSQTYAFGYSYDLAGDVIAESYPSGRVVNTTYDTVQRPLTVNGVNAGTTTPYVQQVGYFPHGAPQYWWYGSGLYNWQTFNNTLTPTSTWATQNNNGSNWLIYVLNGIDKNETVISQQIGYGPGVPYNSMVFNNDEFLYDGLNRLSLITDSVYGGSPVNYTRSYLYDEFGNRAINVYTGFAPSGMTPMNTGTNPYSVANNHLTVNGTVYDARGNITTLASGAVKLGYDAESNLTSTSDSGTSIGWIYDAEGQRVEKQVAGVASTLYIHDAFGQLAATYNNAGVTPACVTCYLTYDMLGTPRLITDQNQQVVARHDYVAFGEEIANGTANRNGNFGFTSNVTQGFTGQESDGGTAALDYFNARTLSVNGGGFLQPDPGNAGADLLNPQSWNGYSYVLGNPLGLTDPNGLFAYQGKPTPISCGQVGVLLQANGPNENSAYGCGGPTLSFKPPVESSPSGGGSVQNLSPAVATPIIATVFPLTSMFPKKPAGKQYCDSLAQKISNLRQTLRNKAYELETNPQNLPDDAPGGNYAASRWGHLVPYLSYQSALSKNESDYNNRCGGPPPGVPSQVQILAPQNFAIPTWLLFVGAAAALGTAVAPIAFSF